MPLKKEVEIEMNDAIQQCWDSSAAGYDEGYDHGFKSHAEKEVWVRVLEGFLGEPSKKVLDIGTGTGNLAYVMAEMGHQVKGIDVSPGMLALAREKKPPNKGTVVFEQQDAQQLSEASGAIYDVVISRNVLWTIQDPQQALQEWRRVLKPGGCIVMMDANWFSPTLPQKLLKKAGNFMQWMREGKVTPEASYDAETFRALPLIGKKGPQVFMEMAKDCGYCNVQQIPLPEVDRVMWHQMPLQEKLKSACGRYALVGTKP